MLWKLQDNSNLRRFRCHAGHAYSLDNLITLKGETVDHALEVAVRVLEEKAALSRRLVTYADEQNYPRSVEQFALRAAEATSDARLIRRLILEQQAMHPQNSMTPKRCSRSNR